LLVRVGEFSGVQSYGNGHLAGEEIAQQLLIEAVDSGQNGQLPFRVHAHFRSRLPPDTLIPANRMDIRTQTRCGRKQERGYRGYQGVEVSLIAGAFPADYATASSSRFPLLWRYSQANTLLRNSEKLGLCSFESTGQQVSLFSVGEIQ
jgi:hypothetical protein